MDKPTTDTIILDETEEFALRTEWVPEMRLPPEIDHDAERAILDELDAAFWAAIKAEWKRRGYDEVRRVHPSNRESYYAAHGDRDDYCGDSDEHTRVHDDALGQVDADAIVKRHLNLI